MNEYGELDRAKLTQFETLIGRELPESYVTFLSKYNGGSVKDGYFRLGLGTEDGSVVQLLYGLHDGPDYARLDTKLITFKDRLLPHFIAVGCDTFGNQICLCINGDRRGSIWFWDHETPFPKPEDNYTFLAANIEQFYNALSRQLGPKPDRFGELLERSNLQEISTLIDSGMDLEELDENERSLLERAVIKNNLDVVELLFSKGANLRNALALAKKNYKFFPEFKNMIDLIDKLGS